MKNMRAPIDWLLTGEPWIEYRTRLDLLRQPDQDSQVKSARGAMLADPQVRQVLAELSPWPGKVIASHKSAGQPFHKLTFLADLGLAADDPGMHRVIGAILKHQSAEGPFQLPMNIPTPYGGTGQEQWAWALCDAPLIVYALSKFGLGHKPPVKRASNYLGALVRANGWPCVVSKELGSFRGPGRKSDPCPFATLAMLKALSQVDEWRDSPACQAGAEALLTLWSQSLTLHPYMFFMGADFRKLKAPFVWYDLLHVLDVLSQSSWLRQDTRLLDMLKLLKSKADRYGRFAPESIWTAWKGWEFGQKSQPSRWLTLLAWRSMARIEIGANAV